MMEKIKAINKQQIIGIVSVFLLMIGLVISVYLVQRQQRIKSKASVNPGEFVNAFEIKDANGNSVTCDSNTNPPTCTTGTLDINVRIKDLAPLLQ